MSINDITTDAISQMWLRRERDEWKARAEKAEAEVARCHARLEIDHYYALDPEAKDGIKRVETPLNERSSMVDGIAARDVTIHLQDEQIEMLRSRVKKAEVLARAAMGWEPAP